MAKAINCFTVERFLCAIATAIPRVGVNFVLTWGIYTHAWSICINEFKPGVGTSILLYLGIFLYILATISYYRIVATGPGSPLEIPGFRCDSSDIEAQSVPPPQVQNNVTSKENGQMRFCQKCDCWKPDRTHHCSSCKRCILRMDHHCPWFSTCIGHRNHKFFVQFLVHVTLLCIVCFISSLLAFRNFLGSAFTDTLHVNWILLMIISGVMGLAVSVFAGFSIYQVLQNKTTLESLESTHYRSSLAPSAYRYRDAPSLDTVGNLFDLGKKQNWCAVMGDHVWEWILPVVPRNITQGTSYPINSNIWAEIQRLGELENNMASRAPPRDVQTPYTGRRDYMSSQRELRRQQLEQSLHSHYGNESEESISLMRM